MVAGSGTGSNESNECTLTIALKGLFPESLTKWETDDDWVYPITSNQSLCWPMRHKQLDPLGRMSKGIIPILRPPEFEQENAAKLLLD